MDVRSGTAESGDVELYYEDMGDPSAPAVLLIMGLGAQMLLWRRGFWSGSSTRAFASSVTTTATSGFRRR